MSDYVFNKPIGMVFDGGHGWHNTHRFIDLARRHGLAFDDVDVKILDAFKEGRTDDDILDAIEGMTSDAEAHLGSLTAPGLEWTWDVCELALVPSCQAEDPVSIAECDHCMRESSA